MGERIDRPLVRCKCCGILSSSMYGTIYCGRCGDAEAWAKMKVILRKVKGGFGQ